MIKETLDEAKEQLKGVPEVFKKEISKFRTGRASVSILDGVSVLYYGTMTPINQVATMSAPDANLIVIQPWEASIINDVVKAIRNFNPDMNPISDGRVIKLPIPPMDEQRRLDIIKTMKKYLEERKTSIRNIRREYRDMFKLMKEEKDITEDEEKRAYDDLQKMVDDCVKEIDEIARVKEKHIMND